MVLSEDTITRLIEEPKSGVELSVMLPGRERRGHRRAQVKVTGGEGSNFRLMTRQLVRDPFDFSVVLGYEIPGSTRLFKLRRHNGRGRHVNPIEGTTCSSCHVHVATERYQLEGFDEEGYAEETSAYVDLRGAVEHMLRVARFSSPPQGSLLS